MGARTVGGGDQSGGRSAYNASNTLHRSARSERTFSSARRPLICLPLPLHPLPVLIAAGNAHVSRGRSPRPRGRASGRAARESEFEFECARASSRAGRQLIRASGDDDDDDGTCCTGSGQRRVASDASDAPQCDNGSRALSRVGAPNDRYTSGGGGKRANQAAIRRNFAQQQPELSSGARASALAFTSAH